MFRLLNLLFLGAIINVRESFCGRIYFEKCGFKGFTCQSSSVASGKQDVTYQCNIEGGSDVTIHLWQFRSPLTIASFTIKDCNTLRLNFDCTSERKQLKELRIQNVTNLQIISAVFALNPQSIVFENISNIETIPTKTFFQFTKQQHKTVCYIPSEDLSRINFKNVRIGTIESRAFENLTDLESFRWTNVSVMRINTAGMNIKSKKNGSIKILNSVLEIMDPLALQVISENLFVLNTKFTEINSNAINGHLQSFEFSYNTINSLHSGGFSILAQDIEIVGNNFEQLYSGAFQKIGPGLLQYSFKNFGKLKFVYNFRNNVIKYADAASLHPDTSAYKNVAVILEFANNSFYCTCESLGWLGSEISLGVGLTNVKDFHKMILRSENNNTCAFIPCEVPLEILKEMVYENGKCQSLQMNKPDGICEILKNTPVEKIIMEQQVVSDSVRNFCFVNLWKLLTLIIIKLYL